MRVAWTKEASDELAAMLAFIARSSPKRAANWAQRILKAEAAILQFPGAAKYYSETDTYDRHVTKTRALLTYAVRADIIWIIGVWHTSRDPKEKPKRSA